MDAIILRCSGRQEDDRHYAQRRVLPQSAAKVQAIPAGHHDIQQKQRRGLPFGVGKYLTDRQIRAYCEPGAFQVVLHQPGDIGIVFQQKNRLTQVLDPNPNTGRFRLSA